MRVRTKNVHFNRKTCPMILDQKLPDNPPFRLRKLEKALQDPLFFDRC